MNDFATALAESFAVTPARTTGLVIDTFDNRSDPTTSRTTTTCLCAPESTVRASICRGAAHEPVLASGTCRGTAREPVVGTICRAAPTVA